MVKKIALTLSVLALVLSFSAINVFADSDTTTPSACPSVYDSASDTWTTAYFCDGRINAFDMTESVAVYYEYTDVMTWREVVDEDDDDETVWELQPVAVVSGVNVWAVDANGVGQQVLSIPISTINTAVSAGTDAVIAQSSGITLGYSHFGVLYVTGPDGYTFTWTL